jgi:predicted regulator of Ras-like GTPase activity (Roadblock/LC7/MglB family)
MAARFPDDWREVKGTELSGKDGSPIVIKRADDLSDDELAAIVSK